MLYSPLDALKVGLVDKVVHSDLVLETSVGVAGEIPVLDKTNFSHI